MDAADMSINSDEAHKNQLDYQAWEEVQTELFNW